MGRFTRSYLLERCLNLNKSAKDKLERVRELMGDPGSPKYYQGQGGGATVRIGVDLYLAIIELVMELEEEAHRGSSTG